MRLDDYLPKNNKAYLIFDLDETLCKLLLPWDDYVEGIKIKLIQLDKKLFYELDKNEVSLSDFENNLVSRFGVPVKKLLIDHRIEFETTTLAGMIPNNNLVSFIQNSHDHMFIWSSNTKPTVSNTLKKLGIFDKFRKIITGEDVMYLKPNSEGFTKIYDTKIFKRKYLLIGDSNSDKEAAENSGIDFFKEDFFESKKF